MYSVKYEIDKKAKSINQQEMEYQLNKLDAYINSLTEWNEYAQDQQIKYDRMLSEYNKKYNKDLS